MSPKPKLAPVPDNAPEVERHELHGEAGGVSLDGQWIEVRKEVTGHEVIALLRAKDDFASALAVVGSRTVRHSFGGDILDQPLPVLTAILKSWTEREEAKALDPKPEAS